MGAVPFGKGTQPSLSELVWGGQGIKPQPHSPPIFHSPASACHWAKPSKIQRAQEPHSRGAVLGAASPGTQQASQDGDGSQAGSKDIQQHSVME